MNLHVSQTNPPVANAIHAKKSSATAFRRTLSVSGSWNGSMSKLYSYSE